ncbi:hypothetical protein OHA21_27115 [Actinoplanes sp. NBC_00393]|uniref:hypothetical protein n=1 Tax=Actinoplanes sp. NBC_00393 TaxID=2975953 RepID=UPI002E24D389
MTEPKQKRLWPVAAGAVAALVLIAATILATLAVTAPDEPQQPAAQALSAWQQEQEVPTPTVEPTPTAGPTLSAANLTLTPKVIKKQCFGSAGCSVEVKVEVGYDGPTLSPDDTWEVIYEVKGDEDGPIIDSFELTGDRYDQDEISVSTKTSKTKISVKVTSIERQG